MYELRIKLCWKWVHTSSVSTWVKSSARVPKTSNFISATTRRTTMHSKTCLFRCRQKKQEEDGCHREKDTRIRFFSRKKNPWKKDGGKNPPPPSEKEKFSPHFIFTARVFAAISIFFSSPLLFSFSIRDFVIDILPRPLISKKKGIIRECREFNYYFWKRGDLPGEAKIEAKVGKKNYYSVEWRVLTS